MAKEIEYKFLVNKDSYRKLATESIHIIQGYLSKDPERTVRIRISDKKAWITVKGIANGISRLEFEYEIPLADANELLPLCVGRPVEKVRWIVYFDGNKWEIDEFLSHNVPTVAEIEVNSEDTKFSLPPFIGENVTGNTQYYNSNL